MPPLRIDRTLWAAIALLAAAFFVFEYTGLDLAIQDQLYDFARHQWLIDGADSGLRLAFYDLPKILIILLGVGLLVLVIGPRTWREHWCPAARSRKHLFVATLTLASVPSFVGLLKSTTNVFCPSSIRRYGGGVPYVRVVECFPDQDRPAGRGRCFPAGHASGGFALVALAGLAATRSGQVRAIMLGLGVGGAMGFYQMAKGAHYLSHTAITALIAWVGFLFWRRALRVAHLEPKKWSILDHETHSYHSSHDTRTRPHGGIGRNFSGGRE